MKSYPRSAISRARRMRRDMTLAEKVLWKALRKPDLGFRRQVPIGRYIADFACLAKYLIIEVDGSWHDQAEAQLNDAKRDAWLNSEGYRVIRFGNERVLNDLNGVMNLIHTLLPRGEKGRVEGEAPGLSGMAFEAASPHAPACQRPAPTLTQPSPLEGEGALEGS